MTDSMFEVVAEYPEKQHVAAEVTPAAVQEHRGQQRGPERIGNRGRQIDAGAVLLRNDTPGGDERLHRRIGRTVDLQEEREHVERDDRDGDVCRSSALFVVVAYGKHAIPPNLDLTILRVKKLGNWGKRQAPCAK